MICNGLVNMQSMGIGGGFFMTIYNKTAGRAFTLIARDRAPLAANATMFDGKPKDASFIGKFAASVSFSFPPSKQITIKLSRILLGPLSIATPGEVAGYSEAHKRFGKLPWADLFKPSIEMCEEGYNLTKIQYDRFRYNEENIYKDRALK